MEQQQQWKILIIDDDALWLKKLARILEKVNYDVRQAATYEKAMQWLKDETFQLAVVDVNLADAPVDAKGEPGDRSGMDIIAMIRRHAKQQDMSVIIVTGFGTGRVTRDAFKELGVFDVVFKQDFNLKKFRSLVAEAIALTRYKEAGENL